MYFEPCDLILNELEERFSHQHTHSIILIENLLANGNSYQTYIDQMKQSPYKDDVSFEQSPYKDDVSFDALTRHLPILQDIIKKADPAIKKVTSIQTICDAMNSTDIFKEMLPSVHQLLRLYLTVPISSATSERLFSALKRLLTPFCGSMT